MTCHMTIVLLQEQGAAAVACSSALFTRPTQGAAASAAPHIPGPAACHRVLLLHFCQQVRLHEHCMSNLPSSSLRRWQLPCRPAAHRVGQGQPPGALQGLPGVQEDGHGAGGGAGAGAGRVLPLLLAGWRMLLHSCCRCNCTATASCAIPGLDSWCYGLLCIGAGDSCVHACAAHDLLKHPLVNTPSATTAASPHAPHLNTPALEYMAKDTNHCCHKHHHTSASTIHSSDLTIMHKPAPLTACPPPLCPTDQPSAGLVPRALPAARCPG